MKRQIVCVPCRKALRKLFPTDTPYPQEHVKFVDGKAKDEFLCDSCGEAIFLAQECTAVTFWADHGAQPYSEWEGDYV